MRTDIKFLIGALVVFTFLYGFLTIWGILLLGNQIEKNGGLGPSIGKFINSIQKEIK